VKDRQQKAESVSTELPRGRADFREERSIGLDMTEQLGHVTRELGPKHEEL